MYDVYCRFDYFKKPQPSVLMGASSAEDVTPTIFQRFKTPSINGRWLLEKTYFLNSSRSKMMTIGLDLARDLEPHVAIENTYGVGLVLTQDEINQLLDPEWRSTVDFHFKIPSNPGAVRVLKNCEFRCVMLQNGEDPGLRISKITNERSMYVLLGEITWKNLCRYRPVIDTALSWLSADSEMFRSKLPRVLMDVKQRAEAIANPKSVRESHVAYALIDVIDGYMNERMTCKDDVFFMFDLLFRHKDSVKKVVMEHYFPSMEDSRKK